MKEKREERGVIIMSVIVVINSYARSNMIDTSRIKERKKENGERKERKERGMKRKQKRAYEKEKTRKK